MGDSCPLHCISMDPTMTLIKIFDNEKSIYDCIATAFTAAYNTVPSNTEIVVYTGDWDYTIFIGHQRLPYDFIRARHGTDSSLDWGNVFATYTCAVDRKSIQFYSTTKNLVGELQFGDDTRIYVVEKGEPREVDIGAYKDL